MIALCSIPWIHLILLNHTPSGEHLGLTIELL